MSRPIGVVLILEYNIILYVYFRMWNYSRPGGALFLRKRGPRGTSVRVVPHPEVNFTSGSGPHPVRGHLLPVAKLHPPAPGGLYPHLRRPCGAGAPKSHQTLVPLKGRLKTAPWGAMPSSGVQVGGVYARPLSQNGVSQNGDGPNNLNEAYIS